MKGISTRLLMAATLLMLVPPIANAKCGERFFVLSGTVVDAAGAPAVGVPVGVAWTEEQAAPGPVLALTDDSGRYAIAVRFNTYSGISLLGDRCSTDRWEVSIAAYGATHRSEHRLLEVAGATQVTVAPLRLDTGIEREPLWPDEAKQ
jgi:hypothetical protein